MTEKKSDIPVGSKGKFTESELRARFIGSIRSDPTEEWRFKARAYKEEGVKLAYLTVMRSLLLLCTDYDGHRYKEMAHRVAQVMIDRYLMLRCRGETIPVPGPVMMESSLQKQEKASKGVLKPTAVKADFSNWDGKIDTISDINWMYNNMMVADVTVDDAPSPGAWAHLQYYRSNDAAMEDFYTKVYPRLIPAKATVQKLADMFHDDGRTTFDLLDRLLAECEGSSGQVPVLSVVLPERPGLQDKTGQSIVPEKMS